MPRFALACAMLALLTAPEGVAPAQFRSGELPAIPVLGVGGGVLILEVGVGRDGGVHGIKVTRSALPFADAVIATVKGWRFRPAGEAAAPVDSTLLVAAVFRPPAGLRAVGQHDRPRTTDRRRRTCRSRSRS